LRGKAAALALAVSILGSSGARAQAPDTLSAPRDTTAAIAKPKLARPSVAPT
jgi:hypothetical protein